MELTDLVPFVGSGEDVPGNSASLENGEAREALKPGWGD